MSPSDSCLVCDSLVDLQTLERWQSGLLQLVANQSGANEPRGFDSHPLRHNEKLAKW